MRNKILAISILLLTPIYAFAGPCDAGFNFDGNLNDASGNGQIGVIVGKGGVPGQPVYVDGRHGKALRFDGTTAMRISTDIHYDACPRITMTAWVNIDGASSTRNQTILSTGNGSSPGLRVAGTNLAMSGPGNGIHQQRGIRLNGGWQFVAAVYDFENDTYTLHWGGRNSKPQSMRGLRYEPDSAIWVGAFNDNLASAATEVSIDDVRIIGRALSPEEINQLRKSSLSASTSSSGQNWAKLEPVIDGDVPQDPSGQEWAALEPVTDGDLPQDPSGQEWAKLEPVTDGDVPQDPSGQDWAGLEPVIDGDIPVDQQIIELEIGETEKNVPASD